MAIANPEENTDYCDGTSGAKVEWQNPDREVEEEDYEWEGLEFAANQVPLQYSETTTLGTFIETVTITPGNSVSTTNNLELNRYYTFTASGLITLTVSTAIDACFLIDSIEETTTPNNALTTNDEQFDEMFFKAADEGDVEYDPVGHVYAVGYIGNGGAVTFTLAGGGSGAIDIDIHENDYRLLITKDTDPVTVLSDETRQQPHLNLNIACGGSCPTRTSFSAPCNGDRACYYDDGEGSMTKIFEGSGA